MCCVFKKSAFFPARFRVKILRRGINHEEHRKAMKSREVHEQQRRQEEDVQPPQGHECHASITSATRTCRPARSSINDGGKARRIGDMTEGRNESSDNEGD